MCVHTCVCVCVCVCSHTHTFRVLTSVKEHYIQKQLGEEAFNFSLQFYIIFHHWGRSRQELRYNRSLDEFVHRPWGSGLLGLLSYSTQAYQPRSGTDHYECRMMGYPTSIKKMNHRLAHSPV